MGDGRGFHAAWHAVIAAEAGFAAFLKALMVVGGLMLATLMVTEVVLRYWFEAPFIGAEETSILLGLWLYAFGMAYATRQNTHIAGGLLAILPLGGGVRKAIAALVMVICAVVSAIYAYYGFLHTLESFGSPRISPYLRWPYWIWAASLFVGFVLMTIYFVVGAFKAWRAAAPLNSE